MSMRIFSEAAFEQQLRDYGLAPTQNQTDSVRAWCDSNGEFVLVPYGLGQYPDYVLDEIIRKVMKTGGAEPPIDDVVYLVNPVKRA